MADWRNRIVYQGERPAIEFLANPRNWRVHPYFQQQALQGVLDKVGWIQQVIVSDQSDLTLDGHLRIELALSKGEQTPVPYIRVDVTEDEENLILATLDPLSAIAGTDAQQLADLLRNVHPDNAILDQLLAEMKTAHGITEHIDFDAFKQPKTDDVKYKVIIADLTREQANEFKLAHPEATIEQYRAK